MERDYITQAERIAWAIRQCGRTLPDIAAEIGCTHATLSYWQRGQTNIDNAKVHLLVSFAKATGVRLDWLLAGNGPRLAGVPSSEMTPLMRRAAEVEAADPALAMTAERLLAALLPRRSGQQ